MIEIVPMLRVSLLFCMALCVSTGCRMGYEVLDEQAVRGLGGASSGGGDATGDGVSVGDPGTGGSTLTGGAGGGDPGTGGITGSGGATVGDIIVDSSVDPSEAGKTTLRDAILAAQGSGQHKTIVVDGSVTSILMETALPPLTVSVTLIGNDVLLDFADLTGNPDCLGIQSGTVIVDSFQISGCPANPIDISGGDGHIIRYSSFFGAGVEIGTGPTNVTVGPGNYFEGGYSYTVHVNSSGSLVIDNTFVETGLSAASVGIFSAGDNSRVVGNLMIRSGTGILTGPGTDAIEIWHNTIVSAQDAGMDLASGSNLDVRNNIISHTTGTGIIGGVSLAQFGNNLFFSNGTDCTSCPGGLGANPQTGDPLYVDFDSDVFELQADSPAVDNGDGSVPAGRTPNGAPDIGYFELP